MMVFQGLGQLRHNLVLYGHGVSSSTPPARLHPKLGMFLVVELSVVHAGLECPKHARLATSQRIEHPIEMIHIFLLRELLYYPRPVRSCVVILQHYAVLLNKRQNNRL